MTRVAGLLATVAVLLGAVAAPTQAAATAVGPNLVITMQQGVVTIPIRTRHRPSLNRLIENRPCLRLSRRSVPLTKICVISASQSRVFPTGSHSYVIPSQVTASKRRLFVLTLRQADLVKLSGKTKAVVSCRIALKCRTTQQRIIIPKLQLASCQAAAPWLRFSGNSAVGRAVALTFDDGPGAMTESVLRILRDQQVRATFFVIGEAIPQYPGFLRRMLRAGHVIGNHTWSHPTLTGEDPVMEAAQITRTQSIVQQRTGFRPCLFRAPYGINPRPVVDVATGLWLNTVKWNVDPRDWAGGSAAAIVSTTLEETRPGSISVMHDGTITPTITTALPRIIRELRARGYRFVTVPELLQLPMVYRS